MQTFFLNLNTWTLIIMCREWQGAYKGKVMICKVNLTGQLDCDGFVRREVDWTLFLLLCEECFTHTHTHTCGLWLPCFHLLSLCWWKYASVGLLQQQQHSCVWYSVGGIQGSPLKFMDQVCRLLSIVACCNKVTFPGFNFSIVIVSQLLGPWTSPFTALGVT